MDIAVIGFLAAFGAAFLAAFATQDFVLERHRIYKGLRTVRAIELNPAGVGQKQLSQPAAERLLLPALRRAGGLVRRLTPASVVERLNRELVYAGSPPGWDAERVLASKVAGVALGTAGGLLGARLLDYAGLRGLLLALVAGVIGWYLPEWILRSRSGARQRQIQRSLPDALDLLSITVEAGLAFDAALDRVARQAGGPLGEEMHRVLREMQIGTSRGDALRALGERTTVPELRSFVLAMVQADVFGVSIARILSVQAVEMRTKRRQRAEEKAQKVPVKIIFPVLFCIFPSLFLVVLGPAVMDIADQLIK